MSLSRRTPLAPGGPLSPVSDRKRARLAAEGVPAVSTFRPHPRDARPKARRWTPAVPADTTAALRARSGGRCEIEAPGCTGWATDPSHRNGKKAGGRHGQAKALNDRLSNLLHGCRNCHSTAVHNKPAAALVAGWRLEEWQNPLAEPVLYRGRRALLDDAGGVRYLREVAA